MDDARMRHGPAPQPSSTVTTLRALVMLACLIGVPAFAFRITDFPIREYVIERLGGSVSEADTRADLDEAPPFVAPGSNSLKPVAGIAPATTDLSPAPASPPGFGPTAPSGQQPWSESGPSSPGQFSSPNLPQGIPSSPATVLGGPAGQGGRGSDAVLANYDSPTAPPNRTAVPLPPGQSGGMNGNGTHNYGEHAPPNQNVGVPPQAAQTVGGPDTIDQFVNIEKRLRDLGADYYLLENWGNQGECYRFHCRVAVGNSANFTKHFEATDAQPLGAMTRVLADVESWRRGSSAWEPPPVTPTAPSQSPNVQTQGQTTSPHGPYAR